MILKDIISGCLRNDRGAQEALYRRCFPMLKSMCSRYTHDQDHLVSIINDGMLKVFQKLDQYDIDRPIEGWVRTIVYRSLSDHYRHENKYLKFLVLEDVLPSSIHEDVAHTIDYEVIYSLLDQLAPTSREVFVLHAIEGYTHKEIALRLGMSDGTSKWYLSDARRRLQAIIYKDYKDLMYDRS